MRFHGASGRFCTLLTPMSRKIGMPSDSMNRSYGVFGRPNLPKPARLPAVGSCQWEPGTSCMVGSSDVVSHLDDNLPVLHRGRVGLHRDHARRHHHLAGADVELTIMEVAFDHVTL